MQRLQTNRYVDIKADIFGILRLKIITYRLLRVEIIDKNMDKTINSYLF
jgi:hypothetical protein